MGSTEVYNRGQHVHGPLSNSTLLCNCRNHSNILVFNNLVLHMQVLLSEVLTHYSTLFCIWGNELSMNISQVKKLRKIVRIKKLATKNNKIFVCTMKKTSVHYKMVLTIIPCLFLFLCPISNIEKIFMHILVFRPFQSSSLMITSQTTCMVRRRGRYSYNTHGSILKCF